MTSVDERTFARAFLHLLGSANEAPLSVDHVKDPSLLDARPLTVVPEFRDLRQRHVQAVASTTSDQPVAIVLKSIKAPKFSIKLVFDGSLSILSVKEALLGDPDGPFAGDDDYDVAGLKFLVKGKVLPDHKKLAEVAGDDNEITIMVMVSKRPAAAPVKDTSVHNQALWTDIKAAIVKHLGPEDGEEMWSSLKSKWSK